MTRNKIKSSKSEALYDVLIRTLGVSDNYYERESFIYHHSVCNHEVKDYKLKIPKDLNTVWKFTISDLGNWISCKNLKRLDSNSLLEQEVIKNKANTLIKYILEN